MPKLQEIKRKNDSKVYSVNIPLEIVDELEWKKGQDIDARMEDGKVILSKSEEKQEVIEKDG